MNTLVILQKMGVDLLKIKNPEFRELLIDIFKNYVFDDAEDGRHISYDIDRFCAVKKFVEDYIKAKEE